MDLLAKFGLLEWTFVVILVGLVGAAGLFFVYILVQFFRNPARRGG
jgi:hypothetical protein